MTYEEMVEKVRKLTEKNNYLTQRVEDLADRAQVEVIRRGMAEKKLKKLQEQKN